MAARDVLKNFNLFVDGRGYAGQVTGYQPPDLATQVEDFRAGGMDSTIPIDMGMQTMQATFTLIQYSADVLALWGVAQGAPVGLTARGALEDFDGTVKPVAHKMRGKIITIARGEWQAGQQAPLTVTVGLTYYSETINGVTINEIDVEGMRRVIGGVDRLAAQRRALGL